MQAKYSFQGKIALITGGATRIGAALSEALHEGGAQVIIHYNHSMDKADALAKKLNNIRQNSASTIWCDLCDMEAIPKMLNRIAEDYESLDILINNASTYYKTPIGFATQNDWDNLFGSNARGPFFVSQTAAKLLKKNKGNIVNLVDIHADRPHPEHAIYCMAKAANAMMVKSLARDLAPEVRVNGVSPGAAMWPENFDDDNEKKEILSRIPLGRPSGAQQIVNAVLFMIAGSDYITGQILSVDGGRTIQQ